MFEIERKFLLSRKEAQQWRVFGQQNEAKAQKLTQAYLAVEGKAVWRVRVCEGVEGAEAYWTFKRPTDNPLVRHEEESSMPVDKAKRLTEASERVIVKTRTKINANGHVFELDVFEKEHAGLFLLEIELPTAETAIRWPEGLPQGRDVTDEAEYNNAVLAHKTAAIRMTAALSQSAAANVKVAP